MYVSVIVFGVAVLALTIGLFAACCRRIGKVKPIDNVATKNDVKNLFKVKKKLLSQQRFGGGRNQLFNYIGAAASMAAEAADE